MDRSWMDSRAMLTRWIYAAMRFEFVEGVVFDACSWARLYMGKYWSIQ